MAHVLIVDDEEADLHLMRSLLEGAGHEVTSATNGEEAFKAYLSKDIDVVVTDIKMSRGDGLELISALRGMDADAAIVAVSGQRPHKLQIAQLAGARVVLPKPLTRDSLTEAVTEALTPPETNPFGR